METKRSDYSLLLNELHSKAAEQDLEKWTPGTELPVTTPHLGPVVPLERLEGDSAHPQQLRVGNLWLLFDKDGTLVRLRILDKGEVFHDYKAEPPKEKLS